MDAADARRHLDVEALALALCHEVRWLAESEVAMAKTGAPNEGHHVWCTALRLD